MKYPAAIPIPAERTMIRIGCIFLNERKSISAKIQTEMTNAPSFVSKAAFIPSGKKTGFQVETAAAPINPTTAGFKPRIASFTKRFS